MDNSDVALSDVTIIACAALRGEIEALQEQGFLNGGTVHYLEAGNHERPWDMEKDLPPLLEEAEKGQGPIIVALGKKCYFNPSLPEKTIDDLIAEHSQRAVRLVTDDCFDMLCDKACRKDIAGGRNVYWLTPGWLKERQSIFGTWDQGKANETFPMHETAVMVDALNYFDDLSMNSPEVLLEFCDWMQLGIEPHPASLERFKTLLKEAMGKY